MKWVGGQRLTSGQGPMSESNTNTLLTFAIRACKGGGRFPCLLIEPERCRKVSG